MSDTVERRWADLDRADPEHPRRLSGVLVPYLETAPNFSERFEPGAFSPLPEDLRLTIQHRRDRIISRIGAGLTLTDGDDALRLQADLPEGIVECDQALRSVRAGLLRGFSIEFISKLDAWISGVRSIKRAQLTGTSLVDSPAYRGAVVVARADAPRRRRRVWL